MDEIHKQAAQGSFGEDVRRIMAREETPAQRQARLEHLERLQADPAGTMAKYLDDLEALIK